MLPVAAFAFAVTTACTKTVTKEVPDDDDDDDTGEAGAALPMSMRPSVLYSGVDGTHSFRVPFALYNAGGDLTVTVADTSIATVTTTALTDPGTDVGKYYMLTMKAQGTTTVTAKSGGTTVTATLTVSDYGAGTWDTGQQRYTNGPDTADPPCTQCHSGASGVDHSPAALGGVNDTKVTAIITTGIGTDNFPIQIGGKPGHKWSTTPDQLTGLVTYLRALDPKGFN